MRNPFTWLSSLRASAHPSMEQLLAHSEGARIPEVERHLMHCAACHEEVGALRRAVLDSNSTADLAVPLEEVYSGLQLRMDALRSTVPAREFHENLEETVELLFGKEASRHIRHTVAAHTLAGGSFPETHPLFSAFLGTDAAEVLANRLAGVVA